MGSEGGWVSSWRCVKPFIKINIYFLTGTLKHKELKALRDRSHLLLTLVLGLM